MFKDLAKFVFAMFIAFLLLALFFGNEPVTPSIVASALGGFITGEFISVGVTKWMNRKRK